MTVLAAEITNDPKGLGYAELLPDQPGRVVDLLNAPAYSLPKSRFVTARGVLAEVTGGAAILDKLEQLGSVVPEVKWAMRFLVGEQGIDVGHARTRGLLDALAQQGALTQDEADALKNLANQPASRADELGLDRVTEADLRSAGVI